MKNLLGSVITARKRSLGQGNVFTRMCHSIHRGEEVCLGRVYLKGGLPPGGLDPGELGRPPEIHEILRDTVNKRAVRILLECFLVPNKNTFSAHVWSFLSKNVYTSFTFEYISR